LEEGIELPIEEADECEEEARNNDNRINVQHSWERQLLSQLDLREHTDYQ
jgi:hypothetical protein